MDGRIYYHSIVLLWLAFIKRIDAPNSHSEIVGDLPTIEEPPEQTRRNRGKPEQTQTPEQRGPLGRRQRRVNGGDVRRQRRLNHQNSDHSDGDRASITRTARARQQRRVNRWRPRQWWVAGTRDF
ncbi:hypothetical protein Fot_51542 [Forsythia ovata]|uniref:Secreted protein n=1 Tax=Forsythia ovata TaxID=205694 RepID=A0ABD1PVP9_9LAMI